MIDTSLLDLIILINWLTKKQFWLLSQVLSENDDDDIKF